MIRRLVDAAVIVGLLAGFVFLIVFAAPVAGVP